MRHQSSTTALVDRLAAATDRHDLEALVACFAPGFRNETPVHPARSFVGVDQVRKNWAQIFAGVPDLRAKLIRTANEGETAWLEWEMSGTRRDGSEHLMRGVTIFGVEHERLAWVRFYLEPVERGDADIDSAVREAVRA